jgi:GrpB-like predicted nucleotidyltransferase (UPF0157 family)
VPELLKPLHEMSSEELGKLFPIVLNEHQSVWKTRYLAEQAVLEEAVGRENIVRMSHYGSTSVPGLIAKPTIDILLEIKGDADLARLKRDVLSAGYLYSEQPDDYPPHMMFMKGYTPRGFQGQVFHIHVRYGGEWDELYFRDYLISYPGIAEEYGKLKRVLKEEYEHDRDGYTHAKTDFIRRYSALAKEEFAGRYR